MLLPSLLDAAAVLADAIDPIDVKLDSLHAIILLSLLLIAILFDI